MKQTAATSDFFYIPKESFPFFFGTDDKSEFHWNNHTFERFVLWSGWMRLLNS